LPGRLDVSSEFSNCTYGRVVINAKQSQLDRCALILLPSSWSLFICHTGEHIDYALFGVLPAAIDRDILVACAPRPEAHGDSPGSVVAENLHPKYSRQEFFPTIKQSPLVRGGEGRAEVWFLDIDTTVLRWENYIKAGYYVRSTQKLPDGSPLTN